MRIGSNRTNVDSACKGEAGRPPKIFIASFRARSTKEETSSSLTLYGAPTEVGKNLVVKERSSCSNPDEFLEQVVRSIVN